MNKIFLLMAVHNIHTSASYPIHAFHDKSKADEAKKAFIDYVRAYRDGADLLAKQFELGEFPDAAGGLYGLLADYKESIWVGFGLLGPLFKETVLDNLSIIPDTFEVLDIMME